jgi:hypothetical protein
VFELDSAGLVAARALPVVSGVQQSLQPVYQVNASVLATLPFDLSTADTQYDLDQINIGPLPVSLSGQGSVSIVIAADGEAANVEHDCSVSGACGAEAPRRQKPAFRR